MIGERTLNFYERLAKGGTGYIVIGDVAPVRAAGSTPALFADSQIESFKTLADRVHKHGAKLGVQIFYPEYDAPVLGSMIQQCRILKEQAAKAKLAGDEQLTAEKAAEASKLERETYAKLHHDQKNFVNEVTLEQIKEMICACAERAFKAGADAVEIHGDRLLGTFCSRELNRRTDEYGGGFGNRIRFALETAAAIRERVPEMAVEYKLPIITVNEDGSLRGKGGLEEEEAAEFAKALEKAGVDFIQAAQANHTGRMTDTIPQMGEVDYAWILPAARKIKEAVSIPVAAAGRIVTLARGEEILQSGDSDLIAYGRSLLTDPDLGVKAETGEPVRECMNCNRGCLEAVQSHRYISCVLNAENGDEGTIALKPSEVIKDIAVVGGGMAGLEAARVAAKRGHHVTLFERSERLGGQVLLAAAPPKKDEMLRAVEYYEKILPYLGVQTVMGQEPDAETLNRYDEIIAAVGTHNMELPFKSENSNVVSAWEILKGTEAEGNCVVIGGGYAGCEIAEFLAKKGHPVSVVEMNDYVAAEECFDRNPFVAELFRQFGIGLFVHTRVHEIRNNVIYAVNLPDQTPVEIQADTIIASPGSQKNILDLAGIQKPVHYVGDCSDGQTGDIASAVRSGYHTANEL